ncbi:DUF2147 domain-containing protein [Rhodoferax sp. UBA5149]|uniref:DUF2147 domain-containing protein n=1 Tax=Rhodoferax sp. UBA5149 TaxID=1947379 RepID=UPI0025F9A0D4|nr:DUF2147 domain-containing protein [Rhodoferax sp. UBA5149]
MNASQWKCVALLASALTCAARAQTADDYVGHWLTAAGDGVVSLERCALGKNSSSMGLCGVVVWDRNVEKPQRTEPLDCNRKVVEFAQFDGTSWTKGWAYDSRTNKTYRSKIRLKDGKLHARYYLGHEMFGESEVWARVSQVPSGCAGKSPEGSGMLEPKSK